MLEKGGLLDSHLVADLADAHNPAAWPIAGYSYFILREGNHTPIVTVRKPRSWATSSTASTGVPHCDADWHGAGRLATTIDPVAIQCNSEWRCLCVDVQ